jgi:hypothetical protein
MRRFPTWLVLLWCPFAFAQSIELPIGSLLLSLGTEQAIVMTEINTRFQVVRVTVQPEMFFVSDGKPPNVHVIGGVAFQNGRLSWIQRAWGSFEGKTNSTEITKALFSAIESATTSSGEIATVTTRVQRVPGAEFKTVDFEFPGRKVTVTSTEGDAKSGGLQVSIAESIKARQP